MGKLAAWLRALGYDTLFVNPIDDSDLVRIAASENRIILTKDTGIMQRRLITSGEVKALFIRGTDFREQLEQVIKEFGLQQTMAFSRCLKCNTLLAKANLEDAQTQVPPKIARMYKVYFYCASCHKYFWQGSHWQRMMNILNNTSARS